METKIDIAVIGRLATPFYYLQDSTLEGYEQPNTVRFHRPGKDTNPFTSGFLFPESNVSETVLKSAYDADKLLDKETLLRIFNAKDTVLKWKALNSFFAEYSSYTVFSFKPQIRHHEDLELALDELSQVASIAKNIPSAMFIPINKKLMEFTRKKLVQYFATLYEEGFDTSTLWRQGWILNGKSLSDFYSLNWMLWSETQAIVSEPNTMAVTEEEFLCVFKIANVEMVHKAMRQALILYHGRDPIVEKPL